MVSLLQLRPPLLFQAVLPICISSRCCLFQLFCSDFSQCNNTVYGFNIEYTDWYALCQLSRIYETFRTDRGLLNTWVIAYSVDYMFERAQDKGRTLSPCPPMGDRTDQHVAFSTAASINITKHTASIYFVCWRKIWDKLVLLEISWSTTEQMRSFQLVFSVQNLITALCMFAFVSDACVSQWAFICSKRTKKQMALCLYKEEFPGKIWNQVFIPHSVCFY